MPQLIENNAEDFSGSEDESSSDESIDTPPVNSGGHSQLVPKRKPRVWILWYVSVH